MVKTKDFEILGKDGEVLEKVSTASHNEKAQNAKAIAAIDYSIVLLFFGGILCMFAAIWLPFWSNIRS